MTDDWCCCLGGDEKRREVVLMDGAPSSAPDLARLDSQIKQAVQSVLEGFVSLVKSCRLGESALQSDIEGIQSQIYAAKIVHNAGTLMDIVDSVEESSLVGDVSSANADADAYDATLKSARSEIECDIRSVGSECRELLARCEQHYYESLARQRRADDREAPNGQVKSGVNEVIVESLSSTLRSVL